MREQAPQDRTDPREQIGHAGQVADHVVAVESQERQELLEDLELNQHRDDEQRLEVRGEEHQARHQREQRIEVHATHVGPQASPLAQAVRVGHVGVEGGPHDVEPDPHHAGASAAVPACRRMADLVERGRCRDGAEKDEEQERAVDDGPEALGHPVRTEEPHVEHDQPRDRRHHHERDEQRQEGSRDPVDHASRDHGRAELQREQRIRRRDLGRGPVVLGQDSQGLQLLLDQVLHAVGIDPPAEHGGHLVRDLVQVAIAVQALRHEVQERRELDHLPVGAPHEVRGLLEPRSLVLAEQLDALAQPEGNPRKIDRLRCGDPLRGHGHPATSPGRDGWGDRGETGAARRPPPILAAGVRCSG